MQKCYFFQISVNVSKNDSGFMRVKYWAYWIWNWFLKKIVFNDYCYISGFIFPSTILSVAFRARPCWLPSVVLHWTHRCHWSATTLKFTTGEANNTDHFVPVQFCWWSCESYFAKHWYRPSTWKADASPSRTMCQRLLRNSKDATRSPKNWPCFHSTNSNSYQVFGYNSGTSMIHRAPTVQATWHKGSFANIQVPDATGHPRCLLSMSR